MRFPKLAILPGSTLQLRAFAKVEVWSGPEGISKRKLAPLADVPVAWQLSRSDRWLRLNAELTSPLQDKVFPSACCPGLRYHVNGQANKTVPAV